MRLVLSDVCLAVIVLFWIALEVVKRWTDRRGTKAEETARSERAQKTVTKNSPSRIDHCTSQLPYAPTRDQSAIPIINNLSGNAAPFIEKSLSWRSEAVISPPDSVERLEPRLFDSDWVSGQDAASSSSNASESSTKPSSSTRTFSGARNETINKQLSSTEKLSAPFLETCRIPAHETECSGNFEEDCIQDKDLSMDSWRRRRMLEKTSNVSTEDSSNWRSRVYQQENTNSSNSSSDIKERRFSNRSETLGSLDTRNADTSAGSRRRRSEDSNSSDLAERLARRRAKRLEERRESASQDGSFDSTFSKDRRWSRDGSSRSVDSTESGENEQRMVSRRSEREGAGTDTRRSSRMSSRDSVMSADSLDNPEQDMGWSNRKVNDGSNTGHHNLASTDFRSSKSTFSTYDEEIRMKTSRPDSSVLAYTPSESSDPGEHNRKLECAQDFEHSTFSESNHSPLLALNTNNNNDVILLHQMDAIFSNKLRKPRMDNFIDDFSEAKVNLLSALNGNSEIVKEISNVKDSGTGQLQPNLSGQNQAQSMTVLVTSSNGEAPKYVTAHEEVRAALSHPDSEFSRFHASPRRMRAVVLADTDHSNMSNAENNGETSHTSTALSEMNGIFGCESVKEVTNNTTDNLKVADQGPSPRRRKPRKDKSSLRKSALNMADESVKPDIESEDSSQLGQGPGQQDERPRRKLLTATRQKFMQTAASTSSDTTPTPATRFKIAETSGDPAPKKIVRGRNDFNQLLQKFSGSESNSEKSDTDTGAGGSTVSGVPRRRSLVRRQEAKDVVSSSEDSDVRKTPERSQSLRITPKHDETLPSASTTQNAVAASLEKSSSFRSEFMNKTWAQKSANAFHTQKETSPASGLKAAPSSVKDQGAVAKVEPEPAPAKTRKQDTVTLTSSTKQSQSTSAVLSNRQGPRSPVDSSKTEDSVSSGKLEQSVNVSGVKQENPTPISNVKRETTSSVKQDDQVEAVPISKQEQKQSVSSIKQHTDTSVSHAKEELSTALSRGKEENVASVSRGNEEHKISISVDKDEQKISVPINKEPSFTPVARKEQLTPLSSDKKEHATSISSGKQEETKSISSKKQEQTTSITSGKQEQTSASSGKHTASISSGKHEYTISASSGKQEQTTSISSGKQEQTTSISSGKQEQTTSISSGKQEQTISISSGNQEQTTSISSGKQEQTTSIINGKQEQTTSIINEKQEQITSASREESLMKSVSGDKDDHVTPTRSLQEERRPQDPKITPKSSTTHDAHVNNAQSKDSDSSSATAVRAPSGKGTRRSPLSDSRQGSGSQDDKKHNESAPSNISPIHPFNSADKHRDLKGPLPEATVICSLGEPVRSTGNSESSKSSSLKSDRSSQNNTSSSSSVSNDLVSAKECSESDLVSPLSEKLTQSVVNLDEKSSQTGEIRRTSSLKEKSGTQAETLEKRKGILKRNTSLTRHDLGEAAGSSSFPVVDPQLAKILLQRKQMVGDSSEKGGKETGKEEGSSDTEKSRHLSASEEIELTLRYSQIQAAQRGLNPDESEGLKRVSVAERIYSMQTKIEGNYAAVTPKSRSGLSTPMSRSGAITPTTQKSLEESVQQQTSVVSSSSAASGAETNLAIASSSSTEHQQQKQHEHRDGSNEEALSGSQLLEKLSQIASATEQYEEKRHRFQHRARDDWRHQTQPVTYEEIEAADSLETVSAFRALVRKKHSFNAFDQIRADASKVSKQQLLGGGKKAEFPQHLTPPPKIQRRSRKLRHMTLPVTAEELKAVPEHQLLVTDPEWAKTDDLIKKDSNADSGILSGSDADSLYKSESLRSLSLDMDPSDNDPSKMSVMDKASMFRCLEEKTKAERDKEKSASGAKRYINRKKRERSQTMPITEEEVKSASEMSDSPGSGTNSPNTGSQAEVVNRSRTNSVTEDENKEHADDELTKLSLSEKVKLFSQPRESEKLPPKSEVPVVRKRTRKMASRFNTQPVTSEEVEKAAAFTRISPLAMSMVKPPDPDILRGLPLKDQRELMAQHAEMFLSQTSLRSRSGSTASSQPSSRRASFTLDDGEAKKDSEDEGLEKKGILKDKSASTKDLHDIRGILKLEPSKAKSESEVHSILKTDVKQVLQTSFASNEPRGILKKTRSEDAGVGGEDVKGILKHTEDEDEEIQGKPRSRSNSQPLGILKAENASAVNEHILDIKSILKVPSQESIHEMPVMKSALRRSSMDSDTNTAGSTVLKSALRSRSKNTSETEEGHIVSNITSDLTSQKSGWEMVHDLSLNSNNSNKHVALITETHTDHFVRSESNAKGSAETSYLHSSVSVDIRKTSSSTTSSTVTETISTTQISGDAAIRSGLSASEDGESSSGELLEDTPRSRLKRKSRFSDKSGKSERYKTQPPELTDSTSASPAASTSTPTRQKYKYESRNKTQPITPNEMREAEASTPATDQLIRTPGGSIADRLNQLKTSGEEEWRKRVSKKDEMLVSPDIIKLREKSGIPAPRPNSIADRLREMETSKMTWRERVEETDVKQFTVAGKLASSGTTESPLVNKLKNLQGKEEPGSRGSTPLSSPVTPTKDFIAKIPLPKDIIHDPTVDIESLKKTATSEETEDRKEPVIVEVPNMGEEMETFFAVKSIEEIKDKVDLDIDDFNNIFIEAEMILPTVRKARPARKTRPSSYNPLKTMSQKLEIRQEYTEVMTGVAEKEFRRVKREGLSKDAGFAQEALAGLASKENFKQVELRRTDSGSSGHGQAHDPFTELMLLHVKGRRTVQTRLVEPNTRSLNEGDCYILVTPDKVILWEGRYANVIEKAKANEVASQIQQKKDLGCKRANEVSTVFQSKDHIGAGKLLWSSLEGEKQCQSCGPDAEDELYENSIVKCNMVYKLEGNALKPCEEYWGALPKYEMLKKNEVIIFDFGTEFYVWQGKAVTMEQRKLGMKLAKQLFEKGYDYTESPINPLSPLRSEDTGGLPLSGAQRPSWAIFGKVNQNMETILFREKFADWPDSSRLIGCKTHAPVETVSKELLELKPFDASRMIPLNTSPVTLKLEGANLGRGVKWSEDMQGFVKEQDIVTLDVTVWHVMEYDHYKLPELSRGQFHDGDTYVVRWQYMIANANLRSLKGNAARNSLTGRERCAYFFWQGNQSTINEKGASALMTVELDEERGPQVRVLQGKEPPCFLNLFDGKMIVHIGKREDPSTNTQGPWRLYCVRGDYENEAYLLEIPVSITHLRSRTSLILLNVRTGVLYIWHGAKSPKHVRELCLKVVGRLKESTPLEVGLHEKANIMAIEVEEGEEKREIWTALDGRDRSVYHSYLTDSKPYNHTARLFHMSSVNLVFEVHEQLNPARVPDLHTPFPFLQSDLYKAAQPAIFLLDNDQEVYLWQGWWPVRSHDTENVQTGSALARFNLDRRLAMETTLHYCREKNSTTPPKAYLVCAGLEPVCFTTLFPFWEEDTIVKNIAVQEGRCPGYMEAVSDILHRLTATRYTLAELQERPLPEGVDPLKLESYLDDKEFEEILEMNRSEFYAQPLWKQIDLKKHVGLF